jgi:hypothetical protein
MEYWSVEKKYNRPLSITPILHYSKCEIFPVFWARIHYFELNLEP